MQDTVITMAKEEGVTLRLLSVVDVEFVKLAARGRRPDVVVTEMKPRGEFLLALACERAASQGVEAEMCLRHGPLVEAVEPAAREEGADAIAFGRPASYDSSLSLTVLEHLAIKIEQDTGKSYVL